MRLPAFRFLFCSQSVMAMKVGAAAGSSDEITR
jgi:hypothetical protein